MNQYVPANRRIQRKDEAIPWQRRMKEFPRDERGLPIVREHTGIHRMHLDACASMDTSGLYEGVKFPSKWDPKDTKMRDEWVATQVWMCFQEADYVYCMLNVFCNSQTCPRMNAGKAAFYFWLDEDENGKARAPCGCELCANEYMYNT